MNQNKVTNATKWSAFAEIVAKLVTPIVNMILARLLSPTEFGVVASITIVTSFADIFTDAGFQRFIIQHEYEKEENLNFDSDVSFSANLIMSTIIWMIIAIFRHKLAVAVGCPEASTGLAIAALAVICTSFSSVLLGRFRRNLEFKPIFFIRIGSAFVPLVITVPLAFWLKSYWALIIGTLAQQLFTALVALIISKWKPHIKLDGKRFRAMFAFSAWNLCETISIWFAGQANIFIVGALMSSNEVGLYKIGMSTINSYTSIITASLTPVLFAALSRLQNIKEEYNATFDHFQRMMATIIFPICGGVFMYRYLAVRILLGNNWMKIADFMGLWALCSSITITYSNTACEVYRSYGLPKVSFILQIIYLIMYVPAIYLSARNGFSALCLVSCLIRIFPVAMDLIVLDCRFKIKLKECINNTIIPIVVTTITCVFAFALRVVSNNIIWEVISAVICAFIYLGISWKIPSQKEFISGLVNMGKRQKNIDEQ